jgi:outer membrane protein OmpA-like peptidoglycan-associated protein
MSSGFGHDFGQVRIHVDSAAAATAAAVHARAFTVGRDIVFAASRYSPGSQDGRHLLAHELAHVAQGRFRPRSMRAGVDLTLSQPNEPDEVAAEAAASRFASAPVRAEGGRAMAPPASFRDSSVSIHRQDELPPFEPNPAARPAIPTPDLDIDPSELNEPRCPAVPTRLGNLTPVPNCDEDGEDVDGEPPFFFCSDSDILRNQSELDRLRQFVSSRQSGTEFSIRAYSSEEGPGAAANRDQYNRNLSCHRLNRMVRELLNLGVQERQIDAVSMGPTTKFGAGVAGRPANRRAVIEAVPPAQVTRPSADGMTMDQIRDAARDRIVNGDYPLAADAYTFRWSCGRFRTLADAVAKMNVIVGDPGRASAELGTTEAVGPNTIVISTDIANATDPIGCAANRIVDLAFHHFSRPVLARFDDQHHGGLHLVHLAGLPVCRIPLDPLNATFSTKSTPSPTDPFIGFLPSCADLPLTGPLASQHGPASMDTPPVFTASVQVTNASGSVVPSPPSKPTVGAEPDNPFALTAEVNVTGDPATIARYEIGFLQTVMGENWSTTYSDGRRERRRFPLPLRDGAPIRDAQQHDPPWFSRASTVRAQPGLNHVAMADAPNMRAFKVLPDLAVSRFVFAKSFPQPGAARPITVEHADFEPQAGPLLPKGSSPDAIRAAQALRNNVPNHGSRHLGFNTWIAARQRDPRAPETHGATQFLAGRRMLFHMDVDWQPTLSGLAGRGSWDLSGRAATPDDAAGMLLRGAVPDDFQSDGVPLFAEFLEVDPPLPRAQAPERLAFRDYVDAVRRVSLPHRTTPVVRREIVVVIRIQVATGRADLDTENLDRSVVRVLDSQGNPIAGAEAAAFAGAIFPEVRKLVVSSGVAPNEPQSGTMPIAVRLPAVSGLP